MRRLTGKGATRGIQRAQGVEDVVKETAVIGVGGNLAWSSACHYVIQSLGQRQASGCPGLLAQRVPDASLSSNFTDRRRPLSPPRLWSCAFARRF